jgi:hypothetical protein
MNLYQEKPLLKPGFIHSIFKRPHPGNALIELNNLFSSKSIQEISQKDIMELEKKYNTNFKKKHKKEILSLYSVFLNHCIHDLKITDSELKDLKHLKLVLNLNEEDVKQLQIYATSEKYKSKFEEAVKDGRLTAEEESNLEAIANNLILPSSLAKEISADVRAKKFDEFFQRVLDDKRLSPVEENELNLIKQSLSVKVDFDNATTTILDKFKLMWVIENGNIPTIDVDISLPKTEECYFVCDSDWYEHRSVTTRINYGGVQARIKIMKGLYYSTGSMGVQMVKSEELIMIDSGKIYLTNKRLIFVGSKKTSNIKLSKILSINPYADALEIVKDTGKLPTITLEKDKAEIFYLILSRLIDEN